MQSPDGGRLFEQYTVAEALGKTLAEIRKMPEPEFAGWLAYLKLKG
jgi:hypothetical protein